MYSPFITFPALPMWAEQLAGILPLSALIDFIDIPMKLHLFQLTGSDAFWNWTITPTGARLLLQDADERSSCCLDENGAGAPLLCIDGRYGDLYPSSLPKTVRLCLSANEATRVIDNGSTHLTSISNRFQTLEFVHVARTERAKPLNPSISGSIFQGHRGVRFRLTAATGWIFWTGATVISFVSRLWFAAAFMIAVPASGLLVSVLLGGQPRQLLNAEPSRFNRLVIATDSLNGTKWTGFYGQSPTVNSLLNKPLYRARYTTHTSLEPPLRMLLRLLIAVQWVSALGCCSLQDWNAYIVVMWVIFSIFVSTYVYSPLSSVKDWMAFSADISLKSTTVIFSSRRAMLSALLYLSPDKYEANGTKWIDPILAPSEDRSQWEVALKTYIKTGDADYEAKKWYWWKFILEGVEMGKKIENHLQGTVAP